MLLEQLEWHPACRTPAVAKCQHVGFSLCVMSADILCCRLNLADKLLLLTEFCCPWCIVSGGSTRPVILAGSALIFMFQPSSLFLAISCLKHIHSITFNNVTRCFPRTPAVNTYVHMHVVTMLFWVHRHPTIVLAASLDSFIQHINDVHYNRTVSIQFCTL